MWVFDKNGFFSAVQNWNNKKQVIVRARFREDLVNLSRALAAIRKTKRGYSIFDTPDADYPFRIYVAKRLWGMYLEQAGNEIDYANFKGSLETERHDIYLKVWGVLRRAEKPRPLKRPFRPDWWQVGIALILAFTFALPCFAGESKTTKIYDKNWQTKGYVRDGKIYDKDWKTEGYIRGDRIYDKDWNHKATIRDEE